MRRLLAAGALVVWLLASTGAPALADAGSSGGDNAAVAVNTKDGSTLFRFAFAVTRATGPTVDATNAAVAYASCTGCTTVAIAVQVVLVVGDPSTFTPTNLALAANVACTLCDTLASAYQLVIQVSGGPVHLSGQGQAELAALRKEVRGLRDQGLDPFALQAKVDDLVHRMEQVFATELVVGPAPHADEAMTSTTAGPASSTTSTSAPDGSASSTTSSSPTPITGVTTTTARTSSSSSSTRPTTTVGTTASTTAPTTTAPTTMAPTTTVAP